MPGTIQVRKRRLCTLFVCIAISLKNPTSQMDTKKRLREGGNPREKCSNSSTKKRTRSKLPPLRRIPRTPFERPPPVTNCHKLTPQFWKTGGFF
mmetsp:Transcript_43138/g.50469  ORF Transcript_43138/g.50469 Transcript_43138/m.50469 type:complete len:94 (+) Transcript_43138:341-622(+)